MLGQLKQSPLRLPTPILIGVPLIALSVFGVNYYQTQQQQAIESARQSQLRAAVVPKTVTALGKLEPKGKVIKVSAAASGESSKIDKLLVKEGDTVAAGQLIATLDSGERLQAAVNEAKGKVVVARSNLAKVKAGAKQGEIGAQQASIGRLKAERESQLAAQRATLARVTVDRDTQVTAQIALVNRLIVETQTQADSQQAVIGEIQAQLANAQTEAKRYETLYRQGAAAASLWDTKKLATQTTQQKLLQARTTLTRIQASGRQQITEAKANLDRLQKSGTQQINEARANLHKSETSLQQQIKEGEFTLNKIAEVRPVDIVAAEAEIQSSIASLKRAEANLLQAYIRSPQAGQIFEIHARPGEVVSANGIVDLANSQQMNAVVEVYQSDVSKIRMGQKVKVISSSLAGELQGTVARIDLQVKRQNTINADPTTNIDERVVEVYVDLNADSIAKVSKFANLQIQAVIALDQL